MFNKGLVVKSEGRRAQQEGWSGAERPCRRFVNPPRRAPRREVTPRHRRSRALLAQGHSTECAKLCHEHTTGVKLSRRNTRSEAQRNLPALGGSGREGRCPGPKQAPRASAGRPRPSSHRRDCKDGANYANGPEPAHSKAPRWAEEPGWRSRFPALLPSAPRS